MVAGDGDAAVDRGIELQVVVAGCARDDHTDPVQIDDVLPMAAHERRAWKFFGKIAQPLNGFIRLLAFGSDQRIIPLGFEIINRIDLDELNRTIRTLHRQPFHCTIHYLGLSSIVPLGSAKVLNLRHAPCAMPPAYFDVSFSAMNCPPGTMTCRFPS